LYLETERKKKLRDRDGKLKFENPEINLIYGNKINKKD
jgi:hypothetical protein